MKRRTIKQLQEVKDHTQHKLVVGVSRSMWFATLDFTKQAEEAGMSHEIVGMILQLATANIGEMLAELRDVQSEELAKAILGKHMEITDEELAAGIKAMAEEKK